MASITDTLRVERRPVPTQTASFLRVLYTVLVSLFLAAPLFAQSGENTSEANLKLPDLGSATFLGGIKGSTLLMFGLAVSALGLIFGLIIFNRLKNMAVHSSMREVSELIYETCKTYLATQGKFLVLLECFIAVIIVFYFGLLKGEPFFNVLIILLFSVIGITGSFAVAAFGMRVNTFANSRTAFAALTGKAFPCYDIPLQAGMSIGMLLVSVELLIMLFILLFIPGDLAGSCFIGFAIGESLGAAALRVAGGIFTKIADIGSDLMKIVFKIKEDDARNPGVIADCTGDNAGDSVGPSADGFETYGVTGVALIIFILLAVHDPLVQVQLLVWIFSMRVMMVISSGIGYFVNGVIAKARFGDADKFNFEAPLTTLVWLTSILSIVLTYIVSFFMIPSLAGDDSMWWKLATVISCGTLAGALIPEFVKVFTSTNSRHVREIVTSSREGGASLNILSGFVAGNFSAYWLGITMLALMSVGYLVSTSIPGDHDAGPGGVRFRPGGLRLPGHGTGDHRGGQLRPGDRQRAIGLRAFHHRDAARYHRRYPEEIRLHSGFRESQGEPGRERRRGQHLQGDLQAGADRHRRGGRHHHDLLHHRGADQGSDHRIMEKLSLMHAPFLLGIIAGGAVIYWFTGASAQAVTTGAYRAVEFIKRNIKLESAEKASVADSKKVVAICTQVRAEGHVEHLPGGLLLHPGVRFPGALLLRGLPDLHRAVRLVPGHLHGQRRRRLG